MEFDGRCPKCKDAMRFLKSDNNPRMSEFYCSSCNFSVLPTGQPSIRAQYEAEQNR